MYTFIYICIILTHASFNSVLFEKNTFDTAPRQNDRKGSQENKTNWQLGGWSGRSGRVGGQG